MTQKTLAEQVAELQNNLIALDKIIITPSPSPSPSVEPKVKSFLVKYDDGTEQLFVPEEPKTQVAEVLQEIRNRHVETAIDPLPAKQHIHIGYECIINGKKYNSIMHASRALGICRHRIKANLETNLTGWSYV